MTKRRSRRGKRALQLLIALGALVVLYRVALIAAMAPWGQPAPGSYRSKLLQRSAAGALHVHSTFSHDGGGTIEEIREAARQAGLAFVLLTDHNDLSALPQATTVWPSLVVGEEVSTTGGHLLALGVHEEIRDLGPESGITVESAFDEVEKQAGMCVLAHPTHRKSGWDRSGAERVGAMEIYNADTDWRDESVLDLLGSLITYPVAPVRSLALLLDRPTESLALWDSLLAHQDVVGIGSCDAHARLDMPWGGYIRFPGYWPAFCIVTTVVWPWWPAPEESTGLVGVDPALLLMSCLEPGHAMVIFRALGNGDGFLFQYRNPGGVTVAGGTAVLPEGGKSKIVILAPGGHRAIIRVLKDGELWQEQPGPVIEADVTEPGVYRCEVYQARRLPPFFRTREFPWIISNPIRVVAEGEDGAEPSSPTRPDERRLDEARTRDRSEGNTEEGA